MFRRAQAEFRSPQRLWLRPSRNRRNAKTDFWNGIGRRTVSLGALRSRPSRGERLVEGESELSGWHGCVERCLQAHHHHQRLMHQSTSKAQPQYQSDSDTRRTGPVSNEKSGSDRTGLQLKPTQNILETIAKYDLMATRKGWIRVRSYAEGGGVWLLPQRDPPLLRRRHRHRPVQIPSRRLAPTRQRRLRRSERSVLGQLRAIVLSHFGGSKACVVTRRR